MTLADALESSQAEDALLILAAGMIAYGLYDPSRLLLILAGCWIIFIILMGDDFGKV